MPLSTVLFPIPKSIFFLKKEYEINNEPQNKCVSENQMVQLGIQTLISIEIKFRYVVCYSANFY